MSAARATAAPNVPAGRPWALLPGSVSLDVADAIIRDWHMFGRRGVIELAHDYDMSAAEMRAFLARNHHMAKGARGRAGR